MWYENNRTIIIYIVLKGEIEVENEKYIMLGNNIKRLRKQKYYTQEKMAELLDISTNHLYRIETGKSHVSLSLLFKIAEILNEDTSELFKGEYEVDREIVKEVEKILQKSNAMEQEIIRQTILSLHFTLKTVGV